MHLSQPPLQLLLDLRSWRGEAFAGAAEELGFAALVRLDGRGEAGALEVDGAAGRLVADEGLVAG